MATRSELREAEESHRAAQAALGLAAAYLVMRDWRSQEGDSAGTVATGWIASALVIIQAVRKKSIRLARRYYRLARAIETGTTLAPPGAEGEPLTETTLGELRREYVSVLNEIAGLGQEPARSADSEESRFEDELAKADPAEVQDDPKAELLDAVDLPTYIQEYIDSWEGPDDTVVEVEEWDWEEEDFNDFADALEQAILDDVVDDGDRQIREIDPKDAEDIEEITGKIDEIKENTGIRAAGRVDRYGISAGRQELDGLVSEDRKVQMVARGLGPNPCSFCAMLASRGFVYRDVLRSVSTDVGADIRRYHDNCHCYPIVRWKRVSDLPDTNAWLQSMWPEVTRGYSGATARRVWRRWYEKEGRQELIRRLNTDELVTA